MNPQFAEVSRILGQSESDRQFVLFSNLLKEHVPNVVQSSEFTNAAELWERRHNTWTTQLQKSLQNRKPPEYTHQDIAAFNNAFNVMVTQVNFQREETCRHYTKLLDEARQRKKHIEDQIVKITHQARADVDMERVHQNSIVARLTHGGNINVEMTKWEESKLKKNASLQEEEIFSKFWKTQKRTVKTMHYSFKHRSRTFHT